MADTPETDRALLEMAARGVGMGRFIWSEGRRAIIPLTPEGYELTKWNPLTNDGDALRLAVKLGICVEPYPIYSMPKHSVICKQRRRSDKLREANPTECVEVYGSDEMAATRRCITRAAAAIGAAGADADGKDR